MSFHFKAFILVLVVTMSTFALAKPVLRGFISAEDFAIRRNAWLGFTAAAFVLPSFWLFVAAIVIIALWAGRRDSNPIALYVMLLFAVPPIRASLPGFGGVETILGIDHIRVLSLALLLPLALRLQKSREEGTPRKLRGPRGPYVAGILMIAYQLWQFMLFYPHLSLTANLRRLFEIAVECWLPYFVVASYCRDKETVAEVMATFALTALLLAPLAVFEYVKGWLLYQGIEDRWETAPLIGYFLRGDSLRAQVTAGHPIVLGYAMSVALGFWLYVRNGLMPHTSRWAGTAALVVGLVSTLSRGPWVGALVTFFAFQVLGPHAARRMVRSVAALLAIAALISVSPYSAKVVELIPFVGDVDSESVTYRQQILDVTWRLVKQFPLTGTPFYMSYMEELRQGQGIIDIVNTYAAIAVSNGLIGLSLFGATFAVLAFGCIRASRSCAQELPDLSLMGAGLFASLAGALVILTTASFYLSIPTILYTLSAMVAAYTRIVSRSLAVVPTIVQPYELRARAASSL